MEKIRKFDNEVSRKEVLEFLVLELKGKARIFPTLLIAYPIQSLDDVGGREIEFVENHPTAFFDGANERTLAEHESAFRVRDVWAHVPANLASYILLKCLNLNE